MIRRPFVPAYATILSMTWTGVRPARSAFLPALKSMPFGVEPASNICELYGSRMVL